MRNRLEISSAAGREESREDLPQPSESTFGLSIALSLHLAFRDDVGPELKVLAADGEDEGRQANANGREGLEASIAGDQGDGLAQDEMDESKEEKYLLGIMNLLSVFSLPPESKAAFHEKKTERRRKERIMGNSRECTLRLEVF